MSHASSKITNLSVLTESFGIADFTDGTDTTGYVDFSSKIPAGALPIAWKAVVTEGFAGDTTAVIQVGKSGDVDMLSASTDGSCLATGTVGSAVLAANALDEIDNAFTPRVTVTGGADFTTIATAANGAVTVSIYYIEA